MVVQPDAIAPEAWTWPSVIWLTTPPTAEQGRVTVVEMLIVVSGRGPAAGAGVVPGTPGATAAGVTDEAP